MSRAMKNTILSVLLAFPLLTSAPAFASAQTTVDLEKFASKARFAITSAFGKDSIVAGTGNIIWIDGVGSDSEVAPDISSLNYVVKVKPELTLKPQQMVAYRLALGGGRLDLHMLTEADGYASYQVAGSANVTFSDAASLEELQAVKAAILEIDPKANVQLYEMMKVMNFKCKPSLFPAVNGYLKSNPIIASVEADNEGFSMEASILPMRDVNTKGKLDLETLRVVSKDRQLYPKAFVPLKLR